MFALLIMLGGGFFLYNWHELQSEHRLEQHGVATVGTVTKVTISHKACNSSIIVSYVDERKVFQVCGANRSIGDHVKLIYLPDAHDVAMLARSEDVFNDGRFQIGSWIGALVGLLGAIMLTSSIFRAARGGR